MQSTAATVSAFFAVIAIGLMAGLFFAFSVAVMPALNATNALHAVAAMQSINRKIQNPVFLLTFMLAPVVAALAGAFLLAIGERAAALCFFAAAGLYLLGVLLPTFAINVPMNDSLDRAGTPATAEQAAQLWSTHAPRWTSWNHLRTLANTVSLFAAALGLLLWDRS